MTVLLQIVLTVTALIMGIIGGWALCTSIHGFRRCPTCRQPSELYENHDRRKQCGWCWLREAGLTDHILGLGWRRR